MAVKWNKTKCESFISSLRSGKHRHVGFLVGSLVSCGLPSRCLDVCKVRSGTIGAILRSTANDPAATTMGKLLARIQEDLLRDKTAANGFGNKPTYGDVLRDLPFEQFMACVDHASHESATNLARFLCGTGKPNTNHDAIVEICRSILSLDLADEVTIITTNYDVCLDAALEKGLGIPTDLLSPPLAGVISLRSYPVQRGVVKYVKIHGCLNAPNTLVFSFGQMLRLLTTKGWEHTLLNKLGGIDQTPSLVLSVGYGFWDRDLDDFLVDFLHAAHLYRNVNSGSNNGVAPCRTPAQFLQMEFFEKLCARQCKQSGYKINPQFHLLRTPLLADVDSTAKSILQSASHAFTLSDMSSPKIATSDNATGFDNALDEHWSLEATAKFLGHISHSAERKEVRRSLLSLLGHFESKDARVNVAHAYLRSLGVTNKWEKAAKSARMLRRPRTWRRYQPTASEPDQAFKLSRDVRTVAYAFESFVLSLMIGQRKRGRFRFAKDGLLFLRALLADRLAWLSGLTEPHVQQIRREYSYHFWVKLSQKLPIPLLQQYFIRSMYQRVAALGRQDDLDRYGDANALLAELLICRRDSGALAQAEKACQLRTIIGRYSNAAQGYRLLGWAYLSQDRQLEAVAAFGRGMLLVLDGEPSVELKLGANLLRVAWRALQDSEPAYPSPTQIRHAVGLIIADPAPTLEKHVDLRREEWEILSRYVFHLFHPNRQALNAELEVHGDTSRHPIYYPECEPEE